MIRNTKYLQDMNFVVLLLLAQLLTSCVSLSNGANTPNLTDLSDSSVKGFFKKYSQNETYMRFSDFESFLEKIIHTFDHKIVHNNSHDDHSHNDHSRHSKRFNENSNKTYELKFDPKCLEDKLLRLMNASDHQESLERGEFALLSSIFVSDLDGCITEKTAWKDFAFSTAINFKRESKTIC